MKVTFRAIAASGTGVQQFGGNITCVEIKTEGKRLIVDAGTGIQPVGEKLLAEAKEISRPDCPMMLFTPLEITSTDSRATAR